MYSQHINSISHCQSTDNKIVTSDLDAASIQVYSGNRIYILIHERNSHGEPIDYWFGRVVVTRDEAVQLLGVLPHYHTSPEGALAALRECYPEPGTQEASSLAVR